MTNHSCSQSSSLPNHCLFPNTLVTTTCIGNSSCSLSAKNEKQEQKSNTNSLVHQVCHCLDHDDFDGAMEMIQSHKSQQIIKDALDIVEDFEQALDVLDFAACDKHLQRLLQCIHYKPNALIDRLQNRLVRQRTEHEACLLQRVHTCLMLPEELLDEGILASIEEMGESLWKQIRASVCQMFQCPTNVPFDRQTVWLRRTILQLEKLFPLHWHVLSEVCVETCLQMRNELVAVFQKIQPCHFAKELLVVARQVSEMELYISAHTLERPNRLVSSALDSFMLNMIEYQLQTLKNIFLTSSSEKNEKNDDDDVFQLFFSLVEKTTRHILQLLTFSSSSSILKNTVVEENGHGENVVKAVVDGDKEKSAQCSSSLLLQENAQKDVLLSEWCRGLLSLFMSLPVTTTSTCTDKNLSVAACAGFTISKCLYCMDNIHGFANLFVKETRVFQYDYPIIIRHFQTLLLQAEEQLFRQPKQQLKQQLKNAIPNILNREPTSPPLAPFSSSAKPFLSSYSSSKKQKKKQLFDFHRIRTMNNNDDDDDDDDDDEIIKTTEESMFVASVQTFFVHELPLLTRHITNESESFPCIVDTTKTTTLGHDDDDDDDEGVCMSVVHRYKKCFTSFIKNEIMDILKKNSVQVTMAGVLAFLLDLETVRPFVKLDEIQKLMKLVIIPQNELVNEYVHLNLFDVFPMTRVLEMRGIKKKEMKESILHALQTRQEQ